MTQTERTIIIIMTCTYLHLLQCSKYLATIMQAKGLNYTFEQVYYVYRLPVTVTAYELRAE